MDAELKAALERVAKGVSDFGDSELITSRIIELEEELRLWRGPGGPGQVRVIDGVPLLIFIP
jgi:hypothetical protein